MQRTNGTVVRFFHGAEQTGVGVEHGARNRKVGGQGHARVLVLALFTITGHQTQAAGCSRVGLHVLLRKVDA